MDPISCKVCGGRSKFLCTTPNEHGPISRLDHYRCQKCGLVFVGTSLTADDLCLAYSTIDLTGYFEEIRNENRAKFETASRALLQLLHDGRGADATRAAVLDIGGGNGDFALRLRAHGIADVSVHEIAGADVEPLRANGIPFYQDADYATIPSERFDVVTLLDVAEHVLSPAKLFDACHRVLRPGGLLYVHAPVVTRIDRMMHLLGRVRLFAPITNLWQRGRTSIFHLQNYTAAAFANVLESAGFGDIQFSQKNELSWPVERYVRVYLGDKGGFPRQLLPVVTPAFRILLATDRLNANKGVLTARKRS
jgi:SAM-dependent methyltransferase